MAKGGKIQGKMAFYKRTRKDYPGISDIDIRQKWDENVAKAAAAKKAADDKAKADADLKALRKAQAEENDKKGAARKAEREKAAAAKAKADAEAAELANIAKTEEEAKSATP